MRKTICLIAACVLSACASVEDQARPLADGANGESSQSNEPQVLMAVGNWITYVTLLPSGKYKCEMVDLGTNLAIFYEYRDDHLSSRFSSVRWALIEGESYRLNMQFDKRLPWKATGVGGHYSNGRPFVDVTIPSDKIEAWLREFEISNNMLVTFPGSSVEPWFLSLSGSVEATTALSRCILTINR